jgi:hypothetical protein
MFDEEIRGGHSWLLIELIIGVEEVDFFKERLVSALQEVYHYK